MNALKSLLQYVKNTNGGATVEHFIEDHEPVGRRMWHDLDKAGYVAVSGCTGRIHLTAEGTLMLESL